MSTASTTSEPEESGQQNLDFGAEEPSDDMVEAHIRQDTTSTTIDDAEERELLLQRAATSHALNVRRSQITARHLIMSAFISLISGLLTFSACWLFYEHKIVPRLGVVAASERIDAVAANHETDAARTAEQIAALQKQVDVIRREQLIMQQNTREALERLAGAADASAATPAPQAGAPGAARIAEMRPEVSPTQEEFILLKERNRLTQYADEAIASATRKPLEAIVEYLRDPESKHLHEAAQVEYMRAVRSIQIIQRDDPNYRLPLSELFKGKNIRDEADLKPEDLFKLLDDHQQPWEVRSRVCFLLLGSSAPETNEHLVRAIREDPSLEVAKQAQIALEQRIQRRFRFFDIPSIEAWWKTQGK